MDIRQIDWKETIPIRHEVLWPNKEPEFCHVEGDADALHYGAYVESKLVSVASVYLDGSSARLRKFATLPTYQGKGIGSRLLSHILTEITKYNVTSFWCDAREMAIPFYERYGMQREGERFYKEDVPYFVMRVELSTDNSGHRISSAETDVHKFT